MTPRQGEMIAHALGLPAHPWRRGARAKRWGYRNHFAAGPVDEPAWRQLVEMGFAVCRHVPMIKEPVFCVTVQGAKAAGLLSRVPRALRICAANEKRSVGSHGPSGSD